VSSQSSQSSSTCRASRVRRVEPVERVELVVSSESSCAVRLARHSQNAWARHVERVESCRAKCNLGLSHDPKRNRKIINAHRTQQHWCTCCMLFAYVRISRRRYQSVGGHSVFASTVGGSWLLYFNSLCVVEIYDTRTLQVLVYNVRDFWA